MIKYPDKIHLGIFPTPIQKLEKLSDETGCNIYIKRDDLRGMAFGGNKIRKLEYILADAKSKGRDCIITAGGSTSNQTVAAAVCGKFAGFDCHIVIPQTAAQITRELLSYADAKVHIANSAKDLPKAMKILEKELKSQGHIPYIIPIGASCPLGVVAYAEAVKEIADQREKASLNIDRIICTGASGNTYSGVLLGQKLYTPKTKTAVVSARRRFAHKETLIKNALRGAEILGAEINISEEDVNIYFCGGKGIDFPSPKGKKAISFLLQNRGIFLDPTYTGKGFAGFMEMCQNGEFKKGENILFIHTGGTVSLFNGL